jgi:hypothetical protein
MLLPLVFIGSPGRTALLRVTAGLVVGVVPFIRPALRAGPEMYRNMLLYNSNADNWGLPLLLRSLGCIPSIGEFVAPITGAYLVAGRYVILAAVIVVALLSKFRSRRTMAEQTAVAAALFLLLTPGFGVQYVVFVAPLLCLVDLRAALHWGCVSGLFIGLVYWSFRTPGVHLACLQTADYPAQAWVIGLAAWAILLHFVFCHRHQYPPQSSR